MSPFFVCHDTGLMEKEFSWRLHLFRLIPSEEPISAVRFYKYPDHWLAKAKNI